MEVTQPSFKDLGIVESRVDPWQGGPLTDAPETVVLVACDGPPEPDPQRFMSAPDAVSAIGLIGADRIATAQGSHVAIRDAAGFERPMHLECDRSYIRALLGDGDVVIAGHGDERITAWDLAASVRGSTVECRPDDGTVYYDLFAMDGLAWLGDGRVAGHLDDLVLVWDGRDLANPVVATCDQDLVSWITSLASGRILFGTFAGNIFEWDGVQANAPMLVGRQPSSHAVATADGRMVSCGVDKTLRVWDPRRPTDATILETGLEPVGDLLMLAPDLFVVVARRDEGGRKLTVWDLGTLAPVRTFALNPMSRLAAGPDQTVLAACGWGWMVLDPLASPR